MTKTTKFVASNEAEGDAYAHGWFEGREELEKDYEVLKAKYLELLRFAGLGTTDA